MAHARLSVAGEIPDFLCRCIRCATSRLHPTSLVIPSPSANQHEDHRAAQEALNVTVEHARPAAVEVA